jgi:hypothetical protein
MQGFAQLRAFERRCLRSKSCSRLDCGPVTNGVRNVIEPPSTSINVPVLDSGIKQTKDSFKKFCWLAVDQAACQSLPILCHWSPSSVDDLNVDHQSSLDPASIQVPCRIPLNLIGWTEKHVGHYLREERDFCFQSDL